MDGDDSETQTVHEQLQEHFAKGNSLPESWGKPSPETQKIIVVGVSAGGSPPATMEGGKRVNPEQR